MKKNRFEVGEVHSSIMLFYKVYNSSSGYEPQNTTMIGVRLP